MQTSPVATAEDLQATFMEFESNVSGNKWQKYSVFCISRYED